VALGLAAGVLIGLEPAGRTAAQSSDRPRGERYAFLVAVRRYDPNELRTLPYAEDDILALRQVLLVGGYRPENVVVMTQRLGAEDPRFAPEAAKIRKELDLLLRGKGEADSVLVALAGHGVQFRGQEENFFCPSDTKLADRKSLIPLSEVYKALEECPAGLKLLLVDACRNDPQVDNSRARAEVSLESVTRPQLKKPPGGVAAFFSCTAGEKAFEHDELKHGVFFHFVIEGLKGAAAQGSGNEVTLPELEFFVKKRVGDYVRAKYGVEQKPELVGKSQGLVPIVTVARKTPGRPDLPPSPSVAGPKPPDGFVALFNGRDLTGWQTTSGSFESWSVVGGVLVSEAKRAAPTNNLMTRARYADFELRLEYRLATSGANSGVFIRSPPGITAAAQGMEIQINDDSISQNAEAWTRTGGLYGIQGPARAAAKPVNEWNDLRILCRGKSLTVHLNGVKVLDVPDLPARRLPTAQQFPDKRDHPGLLEREGHLGLQCHNGRVEFRNVFVKDFGVGR
jgi:hypothetical protein